MGPAAERVIAQLDNFKNGVASCPVPGHGKGNGDRNPSLSVTETPDMVLLNCQAGCHTQDVILALGLDWTDLFNRSITTDRGVKVAEWTYADREGSPYLTVERWQNSRGKSFKQRIPGAERPGLPSGFKPCLYKMPKVLAAVAAGEEVYVVEGEKCVSAAEKLGVVATTNPGGAGKWRDYYARWLVGAKRVTIITDNDDVGRRHATEVAVCLRGAGIPIRTMKVQSNDPKTDLYDHVQAGLGLENLVPIRLNRLRPSGMTFHELMTTDFPPVTWAIPGLLPAGLGLLGGPPKLAKSMIVLDMALGVAAGGLALGNIPCCRGSVLYLSLDNDSERRLKYRANYLLASDVGPLPIEFHTDWPTGEPGIKNCQEWVDDELDGERKPLLVVIDTLGKAEPNFEGGAFDNAYLASTQVLSRWSKFATDNNVAVLAVHHDRKSSDEDWLNRFTGSRGITATAQTLMMVDAKRGEPNGWLRIVGRDIDSDDLELTRSGWTWITHDKPVSPLRVVQ